MSPVCVCLVTPLYVSRDPCLSPLASPSSCTFGSVTNPACPTQTVCARGPGQICGGKNSMFGVCAEGLACSNCYR